MNKKEKRKNRISKIIISVACACSILLAVALPSFALSTGSSDTLDPTLLVPVFPSAVIEQRYTNGDGVRYTYYNDFNLPLDFPYDHGDSAYSGYTYIVPSANGSVLSPLTLSYTYGLEGVDGYNNSCRFGYTLSITNPNWGNVFNTFPFLTYHLGSYTDEDLNKYDFAYEYEIAVDMLHDTRNTYNGLELDDLYMKVNVSYKYDKIDITTGNVSPDSVYFDMYLPIKFKSLYGEDYPYHSIYSLTPIDACSIAQTEIGNINRSLSSLYKPVYSIYDYSIAFGGEVSTSTSEEDIIPYSAYNQLRMRLRSNYVTSTMVGTDTIKNFPIILTGTPTYIDNDFNPIDWVINVGGAFLNMPLFNTASGVSVTIGLIFGSIVVCFAVVVILKIYWGG